MENDLFHGTLAKSYKLCLYIKGMLERDYSNTINHLGDAVIEDDSGEVLIPW